MKALAWSVIPKALKDTLSEKWDVASEAIDLGIDAASEGVLDEIPIISIGVKALQVRDKYQEFKFRRNCQALLLACQEVDEEIKRQSLAKLESDPELFADFADTLMQIACESTKPFKAKVVGRLLARMLQGQLPYEDYDAMVHIVHAASLPALKALKEFGDLGLQQGPMNEVHKEPLLLSIGVGYRFGSGFSISGHGHMLYNFGLRPEPAKLNES
jgi:hypothetical protein